jgi:site-specific recombinase XerC
VDRYLEFVAGRARPNTLRAVAFDLKTFFTVVAKDPLEVRPIDVFDFLADQRGDRSVVRMADRESGLSARTIARRLSSVSGFYAYLIARGDTVVAVNPVPRGFRPGGRVEPGRRAPRRWYGCLGRCRRSSRRAMSTGWWQRFARLVIGRWCWRCC